MMLVLNSDFILENIGITKNKALHYCLKNRNFSKNSDKFSFKDKTDVKF